MLKLNIMKNSRRYQKQEEMKLKIRDTGIVDLCLLVWGAPSGNHLEFEKTQESGIISEYKRPGTYDGSSKCYCNLNSYAKQNHFQYLLYSVMRARKETEYFLSLLDVQK